MEMLVTAVQHQNHGSGGKSQITDGFISSPCRSFKGINCRTFQSDVGILSAPSQEIVSLSSPSPMRWQTALFYSQPPTKQCRGPRRSSPISISPMRTKNCASFGDELSNPERWAGPTYSNSPPPSSLPIPKFSLCQKCSISIELPVLSSGDEAHPLLKSALSSPNRESYSCSNDFLFSTKSATQDLRRILHLDIADD